MNFESQDEYIPFPANDQLAGSCVLATRESDGWLRLHPDFFCAILGNAGALQQISPSQFPEPAPANDATPLQVAEPPAPVPTPAPSPFEIQRRENRRIGRLASKRYRQVQGSGGTAYEDHSIVAREFGLTTPHCQDLIRLHNTQRDERYRRMRGQLIRQMVADRRTNKQIAARFDVTPKTISGWKREALKDIGNR